LCMMVILSVLFVTGCQKKKVETGGLNRSLDNTDLIGPGKGKDFGFGPIGYDMDEMVKRLGTENVKKLRIGVSLTSLGSQWMVQWSDEIVDLGKKYGFSVVVLSADSDIQKQADDFKSLQSQQVDGILTYAGNASALAQTMTEVNKSGIPIVSCIGGLTPETKIAAFINVSEAGKGAMIADKIALEANGAERNILVSCASIDFPILNNRLKGFEEEAKKYPNLKIVERRLAEGSETNFLDVIKEGLLANENVDTAFGSFSWPLMGAYNAGKQLKRNLRIYGVDADEALIQLLNQGDMFQGLQVNWAGPNAYLTLFTLFRILAGEKVPYENWEPEAYAMFYTTKKDAPMVLKLLYNK